MKLAIRKRLTRRCNDAKVKSACQTFLRVFAPSREKILKSADRDSSCPKSPLWPTSRTDIEMCLRLSSE